mmetsp:Transcript_22289/g.25340  ORF Transcript_22289/g.25340 Transcript_22289/m.25340 type:complete len:96 (+) Transcript_22289:116-403(+)
MKAIVIYPSNTLLFCMFLFPYMYICGTISFTSERSIHSADVAIGVSGEKHMLVTEVVAKNVVANSKTTSRSSAKPLQLGINDIDQFRVDRELTKK